MTQPIDPYVLGDIQPIAQGPAVVSPGQPAAVAPPQTAIERMMAASSAKAAQFEAKRKAELEHQTRLEEEHGILGVAGTQYARGVLDTVMNAPALLAAPVEGIGWATGWEGLEDFGRDFGRAASGREAMQAYMALPGMLTAREGLVDDTATDYERAQKNLREQEEAWPMLSAMSHLGGAVTAGLVTGGLASGAKASLGTLTAASAVEGAGYGAQAGYEKNAALRDVATSALIGAATGGGATYGFGKGVQALQAKAARSKLLTETYGTADDAAKRAGVTVEEAGGREAQSVIGDLHKARKAALEAADAADNGTVKEQLTAAATAEQAEILARKAGKFEPAAWTAKQPTPLQKVVYRRQILDHVSDDVATATGRIDELRPSLDASLDTKRLAKLLKAEGTDAPAAIGKLQVRVGELMKDLPHSAQGDALRLSLRDASSRLMKANLPEAMKDAHELVRTLGKISLNETDDLTRNYAQRAAQSLADDMTDAAFGDAGKLYGQLVAGPGQGFKELSDRTLVREALRTMGGRGQLPDIVRAEAMAIAAAQDASAKLTGATASKGMAAELRAAEALMAKAEDAVTLDGGPVHRVFDWFKDKASSKAAGYIGGAIGGTIGGWPGAVAGNIVTNAVQTRIGPLLNMVKAVSGKVHVPHVLKHAAEHAGREKANIGAVQGFLGTTKTAGLSSEEKHERNKSQSDSMEEFAQEMDHEDLQEGIGEVERLIPGMGGAASVGMQEKLATLRQDFIRPKSNIRGKAFETLSAEDLRKNNAMWEATVDPMSVYGDLASGAIDYDKLNYAWKQYPGLLEASQMALVDIVHTHLDDSERASIPEHVLSQLDLAFKMNGSLTKSLDNGLSKRVDAANQQLAQQSKPQGQAQLQLPGAKPTTTQRISGNV